jgi:glycogen operon protein
LAGWYLADGAILSPGCEWIEEERAYNFSLYSQHAESVTLLLFGEDDPSTPTLRHRLDPRLNKTWHLWHCRLNSEKVSGARYYVYEIDGPRSTAPGAWHAFDPQKVLLDPYARMVFFPAGFDREAAKQPGSNMGRAPLGILPRPEAPFPWGNDRSPRHESDAVILEMHVHGFTRSPTSGLAPERRGTYAGVIE